MGTYNYTYSSKPHQVTCTDLISFQYDPNGNMTRRAVQGGITLDVTYNYDNKPDLIKRNGINYIQFTYDGNGQRVKKYNYSTGQSVLYFGSLYEKRGGLGFYHVFAGNTRVATVLSDWRIQFYHANYQGSPTVITDQNGDRKERMEYFPYGTYKESLDYDVNFPDVNYTFTGQEDDDELGLYNYQARLYDPIVGKFTSPDSQVSSPGDLQSFNRYTYSLNNPMKYTDPSGQTARLREDDFTDPWGPDPVYPSGPDPGWYDPGTPNEPDTVPDWSNPTPINIPYNIPGGDPGVINNYLRDTGNPSTQVGMPDASQQSISFSINSPPDAQDWFYVFATREGNVGKRTANGVIIEENDIFVALPSRQALNQYIEIFYRGKVLVPPAWDVGPWNTNDPYWLSNGIPQAELGLSNRSKSGFSKNPAGIDLSNEAWRQLGLRNNDFIYWRFYNGRSVR